MRVTNGLSIKVEPDIAITYGIFLTVGVIIVALCSWGLGTSLLRAGPSADAAAWAQTGGTIVAILGAVWISRAEERRGRRLRRREREEVAWCVRFAVTAARNEAYAVAHEAIDPVAAVASEDGRHWRTRVRNARYLLKSYAERADHLHPAFVQAANNGVLLLEEMEADVERAAKLMTPDGLIPMNVASDLAWYEIHFLTLLNQIDERMQVVGDALDRGHDMLPLHEFRSSSRAYSTKSTGDAHRP
jgi:hypothetical protein